MGGAKCGWDGWVGGVEGIGELAAAQGWSTENNGDK